MNKTLLVVQEWVAYEEKHPNGSIEDFCRDYLKTQETAEVPVQTVAEQPDDACRFALSRVINRLSRLWMFFTMTEMKPLGLTSFDDFVFLLTVQRIGVIRKKDLIYLHYIEISSGILVIDRLIKKGLLDEKTDEADKRSKNVTITKKGEEVLKAGYVALNKVHHDLYSGLDNESIMDTLKLLDPLEGKIAAKWNSNKKFDPSSLLPIAIVREPAKKKG